MNPNAGLNFVVDGIRFRDICEEEGTGKLCLLVEIEYRNLQSWIPYSTFVDPPFVDTVSLWKAEPRFLVANSDTWSCDRPSIGQAVCSTERLNSLPQGNWKEFLLSRKVCSLQ